MNTDDWPSTTGLLKFFGLTGDYELFSSETAMKRGARVHAACHLIAREESLGEGWEARHLECAPYLDAYRRFRREHRFRLLEWEAEYLCEALRFKSHPDQLGTLDDFGLVDLELKSGSMPAWCPLQTAGQVLAIGDPVMRRFALQLKDDGSYQLYPHDDYRDVDRFRALVDAYWTIQEFRNGHAASNY
jgi:hypothetical protein